MHFKSLVSALLLLLGVACTQTNLPTTETAKATDSLALARRYLTEITPTGLAADVYFLASDAMQGRGSGTQFERAAANYLASQYKLIGAQPKGTLKTTDPAAPENYFQEFALHSQFPIKTTLTLTTANGTTTSVFSSSKYDSLAYFMGGGVMDVTAGIVFAGYGIAADSLKYNDYKALRDKNISIDGKWLMILEDEPMSGAESSLLPTYNKKPSVWTRAFIQKRAALHLSGRPKGILVVRGLSPRLTTPFAKNVATASASLAGQLNLSLDTMRQLQTFGISPWFADQILKSGNTTISKLQKQINSSLKPEVFEVAAASLKLSVERRKSLTSQNVLAFIEGTDATLKKEVVIVTSHYDHFRPEAPINGDSILNGAADDASGTAASLAIARTFAKAKANGHGPKRSILFINFGSEELGLMGSEYYANQENVIPWEQVVCNVNMDGVAGIDPKHPRQSKNYVYVTNSVPSLTKDLVAATKKVNLALGSPVEIDDVRDFGSDDRSFRQQNIPILYYSSGLTEHYHTEKDNPNTLDYDHFARVTQLIFSTVWYLADNQKQIVPLDRSKLKMKGYKCGPCNFACDAIHFDSIDHGCPVCGMALMPNFVTE